MSTTRPYQVLTMGRIGVDLYPQQFGVPLEQVHSFSKSVGGTATNVAIAAAKHGLTSAVITGVGDDPFGRYIREELNRLSVDPAFIATKTEAKTPLAFCAILPPDEFPLYFYRDPVAPDLLLDAADLPENAIRAASVFWATLSGLSREPARDAQLRAWSVRAKSAHTVLDLDYRPMFWEDPDDARRSARDALQHVTVAVGNLEECEIAVGESDPNRAADALLAHGVEIAIVKQGARGVLAKTREEIVEVPPYPVDVVNGLGAGDGFGGALCLGLVRGWSLERTIRFANIAGAIVATRAECSTAMPTTDEVEALLGEAA